MRNSRLYLRAFIAFNLKLCSVILCITLFHSSAASQETQDSSKSIANDADYLELKKAKSEHANTNIEYLKKLYLVDTKAQAYPTKITDAERDYIIRQSEFYTKIVDYIAPYREVDKALYFTEQLERLLVLSRAQRPVAALEAMDDISAILKQSENKAPEAYHTIREIHAEILRQAGRNSTAAALGLETYYWNREHLTQTPYRVGGISELPLKMKFTGRLLLDNNQKGESIALIDETISMAELYLSDCKTIQDYDACTHTDIQLVPFYNAAGDLYDYFGKKTKENGHLKSRYYEFVFSYYMNRCEGTEKESQKCPHSGLKKALYNYAGALLLAEDFEAIISNWEESLPRLVKHYKGDSYFLSKLENEYFTTAVKLGFKERAVSFLKQQGLSDFADQLLLKVQLTEEVEDINQVNVDYHGLSSNTVSTLGSLRKEVDLTEKLHGKQSFKYRVSLEKLQLRLNNEKSPEAIALARDLYNLNLAAHGERHQSTLHSLESLFFTIAHINGDEEALATTMPLLNLPPIDEIESYWAKRIKTGNSYSLKSEFDLLSYVLNKYKKTGNLTKTFEVSTYAAIGRIIRQNSLGFGLYGETEIENVSTSSQNILDLDPKEEYKKTANAAWDLIEDIKISEKGVIQYKNFVFQLLQYVNLDPATLSVSRSAANQYAINKGAADLVQQRQLLLTTFDASSVTLLDNFDSSSDFSRKNNELGELNIKLEKKAPDFFKISRPASLTTTQTQALLSDKEALLLVVPTKGGTHVMLATSDDIKWHRSSWTEEQITKSVATLRLSLNQSPNAVGGYDLAFNTDLAHELFKELLLPIYSELEGRDHLYVVGGGALSSLPFATLLTENDNGIINTPNTLRDAAWLDKSFAIVQAPSIQSLQTLRSSKSLRKPSENRRKFDGFGAPALDGEFEAQNVPVEKLGATSRSSKQRLANISELKKLMPLNGARKELSAIRRALRVKSSERAVRIDVEATETAVKSADLSKTDIIAFATHGLLAGEISSVAEPGLVFTPPVSATKIDDGYLTVSEVTQLNLDADWVILSACNTASGSRPGEAGLSGLAQAFLYAGADRLLASHWPVRDDVASMVVPGTLARIEKNPQMSRAEAFNASVNSLRQDTTDDSFSHPAAWAPLVLIGDK